MKKGRFLLGFLLAFGVLLALWNKTAAGDWYTRGLLRGASWAGPVTHGWLLEIPAQPNRRPVWVKGGAKVDLKIQFEALAVGLVPLLALLLATPGVPLSRRLRRMAIGTLVCFTVDLTILVLFPLLVYNQNDFTDILGTFLGLVGFVGAPVIIWFALSFDELRHWLPRFDRA